MPGKDPHSGHADPETRRRAILGVSDVAFFARDKALNIEARKLLEPLRTIQGPVSQIALSLLGDLPQQ